METYYYGHHLLLMGRRSTYSHISHIAHIFALTLTYDVRSQSLACYGHEPHLHTVHRVL